MISFENKWRESRRESNPQFQLVAPFSLIVWANCCEPVKHAISKPQFISEKSLKEFADQVDAEEKASIESGIEALKAAIKGDDKEEIEAKTTALTELAGKLAERAYAQKAGAEGGEAHHAENASSTHASDDAVDAEFEEVKKD